MFNSERAFIGAILVGLITGLMVSQVYDVLAKDKDEESPWDEIWMAIEEFQSSVDSLGSRIDTIEEECAQFTKQLNKYFTS